MNLEQKQLLRDRLMECLGHVWTASPTTIVEFSDAVDRDVDHIEPVIDAMLAEARAGGHPTNWEVNELQMEFVPDGTNYLIFLKMGARKFSVVIERAKMRQLGETMIEQSGMG